MSRLLIQRGASGTQEIVLKPGAKCLGRNEQNDLPINDPTVSGFHCEIDFEHDTVIVKDLGSTNGTFINSVPIRQAILEPGQTLRLGSVELFFPPDALTTTTVPSPPPAGARVRLAKADMDQLPPQRSAPPLAEEPPLAPPLRGPDDCRNHSGVPATLICQQCGMLFCKSCVKTIHGENGTCIPACSAPAFAWIWRSTENRWPRKPRPLAVCCRLHSNTRCNRTAP